MSDLNLRVADGVGVQSRDAVLGGTGKPTGGAHGGTAHAGRRWPWLLAVLVIVGFILVVVAKVFLPTPDVWTDDAYVAVHYATVAPRVPGQVSAVLVDDNQAVHAGQVLATLDPRDYATAVAQAEAVLERDRAQVENVTAAIALQPSLIAQARAQVSADQARLSFSRSDAKRYNYLAVRGAQSIQREQLAQATANADQAALLGARAAVTAAEQQLAILRAQRAAAQATVLSDQAELAQARLNLSYTRILAPIDGTIAERAVQVGDIVSPGAALMGLVPLSDIYIVANYREQALRHVKPGQHVRIHVDAYDIDLDGTVDNIPPASGAAFAPIAPNNATGNFTKIVQRLPVKIVIAPNQPFARLVRVGMSVETTIHTRSVPRPAGVRD